jgi:hypothetical protein
VCQFREAELTQWIHRERFGRTGGAERVNIDAASVSRWLDVIAELRAVRRVEAALAPRAPQIGGRIDARDLLPDPLQDITAKCGHRKLDGFTGFQEKGDGVRHQDEPLGPLLQHQFEEGINDCHE